MQRKSSAANNLKWSTYNVRHVVGSNIKKCRLALGWNQQELADRFSVSRTAVSQYEIGTGEVNAGDLPRLADILGISLLEFYEGPGSDLQAKSFEDIDWAIETATRLLEKYGLLVPTQQDLNFSEKKTATALDKKGNAGNIYIRDDWLGVAYAIPNASKSEREINTVVRLVELAGRFLSLTRQDQETLSRVAEALQDKPFPTSKKPR